MDYKLIKVISVLFLFIFPIAFAQQQSSRDDALFIIEKVNQQNEITIQREVQKSTDTLGKNMDENYRVLDQRMHDMYNDVVRKLILGFMGGFTFVLVGYAWLLSYTTRKYTPVYQRNLLKAKYGEMIKKGRMVVDDPYLKELGLVQDGNVKDAKINVEPPAVEMPERKNISFNYDFNSFDYDIYAHIDAKRGLLSGKKPAFLGTFKDFIDYMKYVAVFFIIVIVISVVLLYFKIDVFKLVGINLPPILFKG